MKKQFTLEKTERLKSRKRIEEMFRNGKYFMLPPYKIFYLFTNEQDVVLQAGFGVSSKVFKKAVERNRVKRLTKEAYRLQKLPLSDQLNEQRLHLAVFLVYIGKALPEFADVSKKMTLILKRLIEIVNEKTSLHT